MWWLGLDDTDTLDTPGTNKLALHLARTLQSVMTTRLVVRHQLFFDPRVAYTSHNGCASLRVEPRAGLKVNELADILRPIIAEWSPLGSDPGFCIATDVPTTVTDYALRCQHDVVTQAEAHALAARCQIHLESVAGTGDGAIGALAAVGLLVTGNDGRVLYAGAGTAADDLESFDIQGALPVGEILRRGVARVEHYETGARIERGSVALSKRLRPNLRGGELILYVMPHEESSTQADLWQAVKVV